MNQTNFLVQYRDTVMTRASKFSLITNNFYKIYIYIYGEGPYFYFANDKIYAIEPGAVLFFRPGVLIGSCKKNQYTHNTKNMQVNTVDFPYFLVTSITLSLSP